MAKEFVIEDLRGKGMTAEVTNTGAQFTTYSEFAIKAGYPDAADGKYKRMDLRSRLGEEFTVLARGEHEWGNPTIYVIESEDGERFLVGERGLKIHEPIVHESKLTDMGYAELIRYTDEVNRALRRKVYAEAYEQGRIDGRLDALKDEPKETDAIYEAYNEVYGEGFDAESFSKTQERMGEKLTEITQDMAQNKRDEIVEKAKQFVKETTERTSYTTYEFIVNKPKRTVVVLRHVAISGRVTVQGKAKAHPDDCFNVHIGKAIALRRALGLDVPDEYKNAPQPTEVRVGDVVGFTTYGVYKRRTVSAINPDNYRFTRGTWIDIEADMEVIDDSREEE